MTDGATLLRSVGLLADGPVLWGRPVPAHGPGVFVVELPGPLPSAPLDLSLVGRWLERVPGLRLEGERPTSKELAARLARDWIPDATILFIGSTSGSIGSRVAALQRTPLGDRRPNSSGHWLLTLRGLDRCRIWWASTDAPEEYEDALLDAFADSLPAGGPPAGPGPGAPLPWAVLRRPTGEQREHGITGALLDEPASPPTTIHTLPPEDAPAAPRSTGGRSRPPTPRPAARPTSRPATASTRRRTRTAASGPAAPEEPLEISADGLAQLQAEHEEIVRRRRPAVVKRVATAREHGDLRENAEYHAAREELGFVDGRIRLLEDRIRRAVVVEASDSPHASLGSTVVVEVDGEVESLQLVGSTEADAANGRISTSSPVGRALVGHGPGDEVVVGLPSGAQVRYRIREVR